MIYFEIEKYLLKIGKTIHKLNTLFRKKTLAIWNKNSKFGRTNKTSINHLNENTILVNNRTGE